MPAVSDQPFIEQRPLPRVEQETAAARQSSGAVREALKFTRDYAWLIGAISLAMLVPLFWHRHIMQNDFASHVYNAWLATLVRKGQAPGIYIAREWNNVLVDEILATLGQVVGWAAAERIVQALSVLTFFWGGFALMGAASRRAAWFLLPGLAMIAYGWTFQIGFSNYYLSLGLGFWAAALVWRGRDWERLLAVAALPAIALAHTFGLAFTLGAAAYVMVRNRLTGYWRLLPLPVAAALIFAAREYLVTRYPVHLADALPWYLMNGLNGVDQVVLTGRYRDLARIVFLLGVAFFAFDCGERLLRGRSLKSLACFAIPLELYALSLWGIAALPDAVKLPQYTAWVSFMLMRFSSIAAVLALCLLACVAPKKWHLAAFGTTALIFFAMLYQDTGVLSHMQEEANQLISQVPAGERVAATIQWLPDSRFYFLTRIVDRACVGRCFSYDNYEPASGAFRLRALPASPVVSASLRDVELMESGVYIVQPTDLPMQEIYQCGADRVTLCMRPLRAGEMNGPANRASPLTP